MDRTSWIGVLVCLVLLFAWGWWSAKEAAKRPPPSEQSPAGDTAAPADDATDPTEASPDGSASPGDEGPEAGQEPEVAEKTSVLENEFIRLRLTNHGAGIRVAEMRKHQREMGGDEPIAINRHAENVIGALSRGPDQIDESAWTLASESSTEVSYERTTSEGVQLIKTFRLPGGEADPHEVEMELTVGNERDGALSFAGRYLYTGSAAPLHLNEWSMQIGMHWMADEKFEYKTIDHYGGRKILGIFGKDKIPSDRFSVEGFDWAGVNDQFFATIFRTESPYATELWGSRFPVVIDGDEEASRKKRMFAAEAGVGLPRLDMNPGDQTTLRYHLYLGPKEFARLKGLGHDLERVMHYDEIPILGWLFGWAIKPLASLLIGGLVWMQGFVGNYGIAIIAITILIRLLIWPVYAKSARTMKRMSKLTPMMQEIREKHADEPQKMNEEMMKLYRTYNINPLGGCLPMFIQLPVFLAFYRMLWSAVELRHESFLWVDDLAMPDTLFQIPGLDIPFNLLPILMGITSFAQIAITPKTGDRTQQTIFMLMPLVFLFICYNFAAALSLYWTTSNGFSILQTWIMNKIPEPELKKKETSGKKPFLQRMQEQAEAAQKNRAAQGGSAPGAGKTSRLPGEKGARHTKGKKKRR